MIRSKEQILIAELSALDLDHRAMATVVGWILIRSLRRVTGTTDVERWLLGLGEAHWDVMAGMALSLVGCLNEVDSLSSLGWYAMRLAGTHLGSRQDAGRFAEFRKNLAGGVPERIRAIVSGVTASLGMPYPGDDEVDNAN